VSDSEEFRPSKGSDSEMTMGEFVEMLLIEDKYYSVPLPRLPMSSKRQLEAKLAPIPQTRKRNAANLALVDVYNKKGVQIEANYNGKWTPGTTLELIDDAPSRLKVRVQLESLGEEVVPLGKVVLTDSRYDEWGGKKNSDHARSRSPYQDWARQKGKSDDRLIEEMRSRDRDKATASGKDYARKPMGFKQACALPREQGAASHRLMEEETYVSDRFARKANSLPEVVPEQAKRHSFEHQAKMQHIFEKYGMQKTQAQDAGKSDVDQTISSLRLG